MEAVSLHRQQRYSSSNCGGGCGAKPDAIGPTGWRLTGVR